MTEQAFSQADVAQALDRAWADLIRFPRALVCRHYAALQVLSAMESLGIAPPDHVVAAVVDADDETALAWRRDGSCA